MATPKVLYNPEIVINNGQIVFKPNTVTFVLGKGETKVEALSAGGGFVETAHSVDVSTKISKFKVMVETTDENITLIRQWKEIIGNMSITISDEEFHITFRNVSMINDPEIQVKSEPEIEVELHGDPAI